MEQEFDKLKISNTVSESGIFNSIPVIIGDVPVHFLTPDGNYLDLPRKWYVNSRYVARCAQLITPESPGHSSPEYLVRLSADDSLNYQLLHPYAGPGSLPELYEYYNIFVLYEFDTRYVVECLFFRLFIAEHREDPMMTNPTWITYLFNVANLISSEEHRKYQYPKMTGEFYVARSNGNFDTYNVVSEDDVKNIFSEHNDDPSFPNNDRHDHQLHLFKTNPINSNPDWRDYMNFIRESREIHATKFDNSSAYDQNRINLANAFINKFFGTKFDFRQIPMKNNELLPVIMREIQSPEAHTRLMSNYRIYHFYLSDPVLFKMIQTPQQVIRIYFLMLVQEIVSYFTGEDPGVTIMELSTYFRLLQVHGNIPPTYVFMNNDYLRGNHSQLFRRGYNHDIVGLGTHTIPNPDGRSEATMNAQPNTYYDYKRIKPVMPDLGILPPVILTITNIPGVALTGSRITQLMTPDLRPVASAYDTSDYDIMIRAETGDAFEKIMDTIRGYFTSSEITRTEKKIGIKYGYKIVSNHPQHKLILDIFAVPDFNRAILTFHTAPVRLYLTENRIYLLPSAVDCLFDAKHRIVTGIRYVAGSGSSALDIIKKQYSRGFTFRMFPVHQDIINHYLIPELSSSEEVESD